jgi:hypothetical protein
MNTSDIIDRLGGPSQVALILKVTPQAVSGWRRDGIPPFHWQAVVDHAREKKIDGITWDAVQDARKAHRERA